MVSIPRSGFCSFRPPNDPIRVLLSAPGFNPSFGILLIQTLEWTTIVWDEGSFNPSFGILLIQTLHAAQAALTAQW